MPMEVFLLIMDDIDDMFIVAKNSLRTALGWILSALGCLAGFVAVSRVLAV